MAITVAVFHGARSELFPLFAEADDSVTEIRSYMEAGEVLVARRSQRIIGHMQLVADSAEWQIKSVAVLGEERGLGVGTALIRAALHRAFSAGASRIVVGTATADVRTLRFYQRLGFRMERIERDAFSVERGYPMLEVDHIPIRDRVWFSMDAGESALRKTTDPEI